MSRVIITPRNANEIHFYNVLAPDSSAKSETSNKSERESCMPKAGGGVCDTIRVWVLGHGTGVAKHSYPD